MGQKCKKSIKILFNYFPDRRGYLRIGITIYRKKTSLKQNGRTSIHVGCGDRGCWVHIPLNPINFVFLLQYIDDILYIYNKAREIDKGVR